jgi:MFS family permease
VKRVKSGIGWTFGDLPGAFWTLWVGTLVNRLGGFVVPFLALYLTRNRGLDIAKAGAIVSLFGLGSMTAGPLGGTLADRIGRRATMLISLFGGGLVMLALGWQTHPVAIAINVLLLGLVSDLYRPAVSAMVADLVPPEKRMTAYGHLYWAINLGFSLAPVIAGLLASKSYLLLFAGDAVTTFLYGLIVWRRVPETRPAVQASHDGVAGSGLRGVLVDGVFMSFVALNFFIGLVFQQHGTTLPIDMTSHGISESTYGVVIAVNGVLIILIQPGATRMMQRFRRSRVLAVASLLIGAGFGLYAIPGTAVWYATGVAVWTLGEIASSPTTSSIVADLAPTHLRGRYQGVFMMSWGLAMFVAPTLGTLVLARSGGSTLWATCLAIGVFVSGGQLAIAGARSRRLERARAAA